MSVILISFTSIYFSNIKLHSIMSLCWLNFVSGSLSGWSPLVSFNLEDSRIYLDLPVWFFFFFGKFQYQAINDPLCSCYNIEAIEFSKYKRDFLPFSHEATLLFIHFSGECYCASCFCFGRCRLQPDDPTGNKSQFFQCIISSKFWTLSRFPLRWWRHHSQRGN